MGQVDGIAIPAVPSGWHSTGVVINTGGVSTIQLNYSQAASDASAPVLFEYVYWNGGSFVRETLPMTESGSIEVPVGPGYSTVNFRVTGTFPGQPYTVSSNVDLIQAGSGGPQEQAVIQWFEETVYSAFSDGIDFYTPTAGTFSGEIAEVWDSRINISSRIDAFSDAVNSYAGDVSIGDVWNVQKSVDHLYEELKDWFAANTENMGPGYWFFDAIALNEGVSEAEYLEKLGELIVLRNAVTKFDSDHQDIISDALSSQFAAIAGEMSTDYEAYYFGYYDPLVLDLDGDGINTVSVSNSFASFDLFSERGFSGNHGWVSPNDGFLAQDTNGDGQINNIEELFGNRSTSGFAELAALDSNGDSRVDGEDDRFSSLLIWRDSNGDGISQSDELFSLVDLGVASLSLDTAVSGDIDNGNRIGEVAEFTRADGTSGILADVSFAVDFSTLTTNNLADTFSFASNSGHHELNAFEDGLDTIEISGAQFEELIFRDLEEGVSIRLENDDFELEIANVSSSQMSQNDFIFV